jgi:transglutaminase-like putative cysteine protease
MENYLAATDIIDWNNPDVTRKAAELARDQNGPVAIARACFEYVRDQIKHSVDYQLNPVTCKASDVLKHQTGFCYAKSHLLAALLRANGIPAGLCYQRLTIDNDQPPYCLHGLNAVHLPDHGWYRIDARGNGKGISAQFNPPLEQLAFPLITDGEMDFPEIWPEPLPQVIRVLETQKSYQAVLENLPDIEIINRP